MALSLARSSIYGIAGQVTTLASSLLVGVVVARNLGPRSTGAFGWSLWLMTLVATMVTLGLPSVVTREFARARVRASGLAPADWMFLRSLQVCLASWCLLLPAAILFRNSNVVPDGVSPLMLAVSLLGGAVMGAMMISQARLAGLEKFPRLATAAASVGLATLVLTIGALMVGASVSGVLFAYVISNMAGLFMVSRRSSDPRPTRPEKKNVQGFFRYAGLVSIIVLIDTVVWQRSEVLFLGLFSSPEQVAFYALAFGIVARLMTTFPGALNAVLLSRFSAESIGSGEVASLGIATRYITAIAVPMAAVLVAVSSPVVTLLYGPEFAPMSVVMSVLTISSAAAAIAGPSASFLYAQGDARAIIAIGLVVAVLNIGLDLWAIPRFGALGAAIANAAAQLLAVAIGLFYVFVVRAQRAPWSQIVRIVMAGLAAGVAGHVTATATGDTAPLWAMASGSAAVILVFLAIAALLGIPTARDKELVSSLGSALAGGLRRNQR